MNYRKIFLIAFVCSVVAAAGIGIIGILSDSFIGDGQLLGTMMTIALYSLTALATAIVLDKRVWRVAMWISFVVSAIGLPLLIFQIYYGRTLSSAYLDDLERVNGLIATLAIALPLCGLLALTRFEGGALRILRTAGIAVVAITAAIICIGILKVFDFDSGYFRMLAVSLILTGLSLVSLPVLHKVAGMPPASETVASDVSLTIVCPRCALSQSVKSGISRCTKCRLRFTIEVEEPRCPTCRYLLYQLTEPRCPECGTAIDRADLVPTVQV